MGMEEEFQVVKDYVGGGNFSVEKGDRVKILETDDDDPTLLLIQSYDDPRRKGLIPMDYLRKIPPSRNQTPDSALNAKSKKQEAKFKREVCINELVETEEEFSRDIQRVVEKYLLPLEEETRPAPRHVMDSKDIIFYNLRQIAAFHNGIMIAGVKYFLKEPRTIGRTLLRLERDFDLHADYIKNEPIAQEILMKNDEIRDYFEDLSQEIGDDKILADHLKLPLQRINDYTLLLEELIRYSKVLGEDTTDLERALELMLWIPTRSNDLKFITNIEGYHGNIHKLGRLIRRNWFLTKDKSGGKGSERYCFFFKSRILICRVRRISEDRVVFVLKDIVKLPEVDFKNRSDKRTFEVHSSEPDAKNFPYTFIAHEDDVKADWLGEIQKHLTDHLTETEHIIDDLKVQLDTDYDPFEPLKGVLLDISPEIEDNLDPIEHPGHRPLKHVGEPRRPPLEVPRKRRPIFECVDPTPSPSPPPTPEPEPEPEPEPSEPDMLTTEEEVSQEEILDDTGDDEGEEELLELPTGKRKPKYIPGVSRPLFHSTIRGSSNERTDIFDPEYNWWKYTSRRQSSDFLRKTEYEESTKAGENAVFECEVEGVDNLVWLKDNRPLSDKLADRIVISKENDVFRLEIRNVSESDSGTYTARAENGCGVSMSTAHLIVEKLTDDEKKARAKATSPVFSVTLKDAELLESTHARFVVKVNGNPIPEVQFYKGDRLITEEDEFIQIVRDKDNPGFYELVLPEVRPEDAGEYRCVASNKYSDESCSCIVNVINEKDVFAGLEDDFVVGGEPRFTWLKNGKPFMPEERFKVIYKDEEDSIALVFQNVKPEDAGLYTCVASTSHGRISCSAELTVQGTIKELQKLPKKAKIEAINKDFDGNVGSTAVIEVRVLGDPLPTARWFRDGEEILASGRHKVIYDEETETASLVIKNLCLEDTGEYNVVAKNEIGSDSQFINLHVKAPPRIMKGLKDFTGLTGRELKLEIQVEASPKPIVQWYKDGMVIKKSNRIKYFSDEASDTYTLIIDNAVMEDAGTFSVVASNEYSQVSDVCHVSMESPPQFIGSLQKEVETIEGDYVSFSVMVDGDPLPAVKWKFNGQEIKVDGKHFKTNVEGNVFTLLISEVKREEAGSYVCEISNQWGSNECGGQLTVKCLPRFEKELEDKTVKESDMDVEFTVKMHSFPQAKVTWYHGESEITSTKKEYTCIEDGDTYKLIIKQATTQMAGIYKCKAQNEIGSRETKANLTVHVFPKFTKELSDVEIVEGETLKMMISCKGVPEPDVKWYHNGEEIYSDARIKIGRDAKRIENYSLTITLIQREDGGEYEVRATNERGTAVTKSLVTVLASTDHKKRVQHEEEGETVLVNGFKDHDESEKSKAKQVKDDMSTKEKLITDEKKKNEATKSSCEKPTLRKRLSTESGDDEGFTVREIRTEEFTATTDLKPAFGLVEEPPENEHYIKIQIHRGVSIVSVSEGEDDNSQKSSKNTYELNEEDELNLELNDNMKLSPFDKDSSSVFKKHSHMSETIMNEINKSISGLESENDANVISYNSSRKSSILETRKKDSSPGRKAVSFDEQPSRVYETDNSDAAIDDLFKRIKKEQDALKEILEKQKEGKATEEVRRPSLRQPKPDLCDEVESTNKEKDDDKTPKLDRQDSWDHLETKEEKNRERYIDIEIENPRDSDENSWEKIDVNEMQGVQIPVQVESEKLKHDDTPDERRQQRQDSWEMIEVPADIVMGKEKIFRKKTEKPENEDDDDENSIRETRRRRSTQDSWKDVEVTEERDKDKVEQKHLDSKRPHDEKEVPKEEGLGRERIIKVEVENSKDRDTDDNDEDSISTTKRRGLRRDRLEETRVIEECDKGGVEQLEADKPKQKNAENSGSTKTSRLSSTVDEEGVDKRDGLSKERIIEIEVEKPNYEDVSDDDDSSVLKTKRRGVKNDRLEETRVIEECDKDGVEQLEADKPKQKNAENLGSAKTSRLNSTVDEEGVDKRDGLSKERIIEIEVEKPNYEDVSDDDDSSVLKTKRRGVKNDRLEETRVIEECDKDGVEQLEADKPKQKNAENLGSAKTSRLNSTVDEEGVDKRDGLSKERIIEIEVEKPNYEDVSDDDDSSVLKTKRRGVKNDRLEETRVIEECDKDGVEQLEADKPKQKNAENSGSARTSRLNSTIGEQETDISEGKRKERIVPVEVEKSDSKNFSDDERTSLDKSKQTNRRQDSWEEIEALDEPDDDDRKLKDVKDVESRRASKSRSILQEKDVDQPEFIQVSEVMSVITSRSSRVELETDIDGQKSKTMSRRLSEHAEISEILGNDESTRQNSCFHSVVAEKTGDDAEKKPRLSRGTSQADSLLDSDDSLDKPDTCSADVSDIESRGVSRFSSMVDERKSVSRQPSTTEGDESRQGTRTHSRQGSTIDEIKKDEASRGDSQPTSRRHSRIISDEEDITTPTSRRSSKAGDQPQQASRRTSVDEKQKPRDDEKDLSAPSSRRFSRHSSKDEKVVQDDTSKPSSKKTSRDNSIDCQPDTGKRSRISSNLGSKSTSKQTSIDEVGHNDCGSSPRSKPVSRTTSVDKQPKKVDEKDVDYLSKSSSRPRSRISSVDETSKIDADETENKRPSRSRLGSKETSRSNSVVVEDADQPSKTVSRPRSRIASVDETPKIDADETENKRPSRSRLGSKETSRSNSVVVEDADQPSKTVSRPRSRIASVDETPKIDADETENKRPSRSRLGSKETSRSNSVIVEDADQPSKTVSRPRSRIASVDETPKIDADETENKRPSRSRLGSKETSRSNSVNVEDADQPSKTFSRPRSRIASIDETPKIDADETENKRPSRSRLGSKETSRSNSVVVEDADQPSKAVSRPRSRIASVDETPKIDADETENKRPSRSRLGSKETSRSNSVDVDDADQSSKTGSRPRSRIASVDETQKIDAEEVENKRPSRSKLGSKPTTRLNSIDENETPSTDGTPSERARKRDSIDESKTTTAKDRSRPTSRQASIFASEDEDTKDKTQPRPRLNSRQPSQLDETDSKDGDSPLSPGRRSIETSRRSSVDTAKKPVAQNEGNSIPERVGRLTSSDDSQPVVEEVSDSSAPGSRFASRQTSKFEDESKKPIIEEVDDNSAPVSKSASRQTSLYGSVDDADKPEKSEKSPIEDGDEGMVPKSERDSKKASRHSSVDNDNASKSASGSRKPSQAGLTDDTNDVPKLKPISREASKVDSDDKKSSPIEDSRGNIPESELGSDKPLKRSSVSDEKPAVQENEGGSLQARQNSIQRSRQSSVDDSSVPESRAESKKPSRQSSVDIDKKSPRSRLHSRQSSCADSTDDTKKPSVDRGGDESSPDSRLGSKIPKSSVGESERSLNSVDDSGKSTVEEPDDLYALKPGEDLKVPDKRSFVMGSTKSYVDNDSVPKSKEVGSKDDNIDSSAPGSVLGSRRSSQVISGDDTEKPKVIDSKSDSRRPSQHIDDQETKRPLSRRTSQVSPNEEIEEVPVGKGLRGESTPRSRPLSRKPSADESKDVESAASSRRPSAVTPVSKRSRPCSTQVSQVDAPDQTSEQKLDRGPDGIRKLPSADETTKSTAETADDESTPGSKVGSRGVSRFPSTTDDSDIPRSRPDSRKNSRQSSISEKVAPGSVENHSSPSSKPTSRKGSQVESSVASDLSGLRRRTSKDVELSDTVKLKQEGKLPNEDEADTLKLEKSTSETENEGKSAEDTEKSDSESHSRYRRRISRNDSAVESEKRNSEDANVSGTNRQRRESKAPHEEADDLKLKKEVTTGDENEDDRKRRDSTKDAGKSEPDNGESYDRARRTDREKEVEIKSKKGIEEDADDSHTTRPSRKSTAPDEGADDLKLKREITTGDENEDDRKRRDSTKDAEKSQPDNGESYNRARRADHEKEVEIKKTKGTAEDADTSNTVEQRRKGKVLGEDAADDLKLQKEQLLVEDNDDSRKRRDSEKDDDTESYNRSRQASGRKDATIVSDKRTSEEAATSDTLPKRRGSKVRDGEETDGLELSKRRSPNTENEDDRGSKSSTRRSSRSNSINIDDETNNKKKSSSRPPTRLGSIDESQKDDKEAGRRRPADEDGLASGVRKRRETDDGKKESRSRRESTELKADEKKRRESKGDDSEKVNEKLRKRSETGDSENKQISRRSSKKDSVSEDNKERRLVDEKGEFPKVLSGMEKDIDTFETLSASFEVVGYGTPRPDVTWFKDGEELKASKHFIMTEEGDKYKLEIVDLRACDAGVYMAKLTNRIGEASKEATLVVSNVENLRGPKLKEGIQGKVVTKRQSATLEAKFVADPVPDATWTVNGRDVIADCSVDVRDIELGLKECTYRMTIPSTDLSDTGTYTVKVKNKHGSAESSDSLTIVMEPVVEVFRDLVVPPTMPCTFEATVMSTPEADVTWYVNGQLVTSENSKYRTSSEKIDEYRIVHRLALEDCSLADEGEYKIVAENNVGKTDAVASLKLYTEKPTFVKLLEDRTVQDYDVLHMKVRVNGLPNPEIKWYRNGEEIVSDEHIRIETNEEGQVSSTLVIEHFNKDDVAEYKCTAQNIVGQAETSAKLTLAQIEPSFGENLKRVTEVGEGEPLDIITKVIGSPVPTVQWFKDGEEIKPDDSRIKTTASPNGQLRLSIEEVTPNDCGAYRAVATNELGKSIANTAVVVTQAPKKPSFVKKLGDLTVVEGETIKLEVQIDGFPQPTVKWLKDGHTLHPCPRMDFISGPNNTYALNIDKATLQDIGTYSVIISNKCGEESNACSVKVIPASKAPQFDMQLQPVKVVEGYPAKLEVKVDGFPIPDLTWYFNGEPLKIDNENIKMATTPEGNHCLLIDKVGPQHTGDYQLVAKNDLGESATNARLTVSPRTNTEVEPEKPVFLNGLRDLTVDESGVLSLSAPFRGNPIPDVQWFKDGSLLLPNERIHFTCDGYKVGLEIQDVNMGDQGFYSCALKNPYGEDSTAGHVGVRKLYQSPVFTQRFRHQQQLPGHDAKFHCRVTGVPFPCVVWHRNGQPLSNSNKYQIKRDGDVCCLTVFNVNRDDDATYSCIASNRDGTATCEAQLQVVDKIDDTPKQEPPQFLKKIGDCEIYQGMTAKFTACASGYPEPEYEWFCDTVRLHPGDRYEMEKEGSGLVRLKITAANPDYDLGRYRLRAFNPHGEAFCEANIIFDNGLEVKNKKSVGDLYKDYDRFRATGAPLPLAHGPIINMMTDRNLRLSWKPSIPIGPREPVTYLVEMEEQPKGKWFTARAGIRTTRCDIHDLKPFVDYKFRVRVENNYGISDPSPFVTTQRERLNPDPPKIRTYLPPNTHFHPDTCHYFPKDFDIERPPHDNYAQAPRFLRQEYDAQYGVKGHNVNLFWFVYGYPKPKITYYFNDEPIEMGGRYDCSYTRNGQATLFINKMMDRDVGVYEAVAVNEHGTARQRVQLKIAEYPEFIKRPEECWVPLRKTCKLEARVIGVPYPEIKWYKDWQPLAPSSRIQIERIEPDVCILRITDVIKKDEGLYSISARNIAGSISTSVYVHIEESDHDLIYGNKRGEVMSRNKKFEDNYDLGDELGRGTQGVVYHAVERHTGKNLAAKVMNGCDETRKWMTNELDIMNHLKHPNIIRPYDSLLGKKSFTILQELASGGDLLDILTRKTFTTEHEISRYIRQLLLALDHMHDYNIAHLGLTPGDLVFSHPGSDTLKLTDFGLSRRINSRKLEPLYHGMPEYVAPEVVNGEGVGLSADMWSVGIITHLLLTGVSLFRGRNDVDTLDRVREGRFSLDTDISSDARDFIIKLLMVNPNNRMDVRSALNHKWIKLGTNINPPSDTRQINTENLRNYYHSFKDWYGNASCRTWFRRRPLEKAYLDPSRMLYPPGYRFTPAPSPEPRSKESSQYRSWKDRIPSREPVDLEIGLSKSESHYQYGPDTYLLQLRDVDFPVRLREYMKVAKKSTSEGFDWQAPVIRERRRFMDVMDEEIDDERKARINQYGSADVYTLRRLKQEIGSRPTAHVEAEAILGSRIDGLPPFFREKPQTLPVEIDKPAELVCYAVGSPKPIVQWFKNDLVITESQRVKILEDNEGRSILRLNPASEYDLGIYKVVARNKFGQTVARTRLVPASEPSPPEPPEVIATSGTEILLKWKQPKDDGNSPVLCYGLQCMQTDEGKWKTIAENIDHEAWLVHDLEPSTDYQFRLLAMNKIGWSMPGFATLTVNTKVAGAEKIVVPHVLRNMQIICERGKEIIGEEPRTRPDYSLEYQCLQWVDQPPEDKYRYLSEIARGRFSIIVKAINSTSGSQVVAKLMETDAITEPVINREFDILRTLRHERIAGLIEAFKLEYSSVAIFVLEKLQGADVLTYLTSRHTYTEQMVATIVTQVLDGLQYLHWKGYCHFNLQPDNVVMASLRSLQVKLVDFSCAQHVHKLGTVVQNLGPIEYTAPEVLCDEPAYSYSDIWSVGVLTYVLLSGVSPYRGYTELETRQNITFVRYRFEYLYKDLSQEATRFIMLLFKRTPTKRPSAEECHEHRWLLPTEYMIKKRERNSFDTAKLKTFSDEYHAKRNSEATKSREILSVIGGRVERSNSIVEELDIMNTSVH